MKSKKMKIVLIAGVLLMLLTLALSAEGTREETGKETSAIGKKTA